MSRPSLNKATLVRETRQLQTYERFLPSLDLKRKQLLALRGRARTELAETQAQLEALESDIGQRLPMLADHTVALDDLVRAQAPRIDWENRVGVRLPILIGIEIERRPYALLAHPPWVDRALDDLETALRLRLTQTVQEQRLARLEQAVRKTTQRVNLFDKVLIPRSRDLLRRIRIALADADRAAVVRSKLAKGKRLKEGLA